MSLKDADVTGTDCSNCLCGLTTTVDLGHGVKVEVRICKKDVDRVLLAVGEVNERIRNEREEEE